MLEKQHLSIIHVAKQKLGLSDEEYREILRVNFKKDSSKDLNTFQFKELMDIFEKLGFKTKENKPNRITYMQKKTIGEYEIKLQWNTDKNRLIGFIERQVGSKKKLQWLTVQEAQKVIEGMKSIYRRENDRCNNL